MNLVLIGYRGSGKSSVGKLLAERLGMTFIDTDQLIIDHFRGMTIRDIWQTHGEPAFRAAEVQAVRNTLNNDHQVVALGGGAVMQPAIRQSLEAAASEGNCIRIYLRAKAITLHTRIHADPSSPANRPGLTTTSGGMNEVQTILAQREPTYLAQADLIVDVDDLNMVHIAGRIADFLAKR